MVTMKELEKQIDLARTALLSAIHTEEVSGFDAMASMDRTYCEGFMEALEFAYTILNGHEYNAEEE